MGGWLVVEEEGVVGDSICIWMSVGRYGQHMSRVRVGVVVTTSLFSSIAMNAKRTVAVERPTLSHKS